MTKRLISVMLALMFVACVLPLSGVSAKAADECYSISKAMKYADKNWDNGIGLCADFVSKCLQAGGVDVYGSTVKELYDALNGVYGTAYKLKLTGGKSGTVKMTDNEDKLSKGDPIFYKCNRCGNFEHVVICNGVNSSGYAQDYAHNNAHNGKKQTYTYDHCGTDNWTLYSIKMSVGPMLYGKKTNVGVPEITTLANGANGVVVKWSKVKSADKYYLYRKKDDGKFAKIASVKSAKFTDKTAKTGTEYTYTVKAIDGKTASQYYAGKTIKAIGAPKLKSAANQANSIKLTWGKVGSADGYIVYRENAAGDWVRIAKIKNGKTCSYTDKNVKSGVTYTYTVKAYDGNVGGAYSSKGIKATFLSTPEKLSAKSVEDGLLLTFGTVKGADGYKIYRKTAGETKWTAIAKYKGADIIEFVDTNVKDGVKYSYTVKAYNGASYSYYNKKGVSCVFTEIKAPENNQESPETIIP